MGEAGRGRWARLHREVLARQHGVAAVWQARELGIARQSFVDVARRQGWQPLAHGVWADASSAGSYERACWVALVGLRLRGVLTGVSALWMLGAFGGMARRPAAVDVLLTDPGRHPKAPPGVRIVRAAGAAGEACERRRGLPVAPAPRAWTDYAREASPARLVVALAGLDRLREASPAELAAYVTGRGRFHGAPAARAALALARRQLVHSADEAAARWLLSGAGLPLDPAPRPVTIREAGAAVAEVDIPWPQVRYGVEIDGPHHLLAAQHQADRARDRRLSTLGWVIDRFSVDEVAQAPAAFVAEVRAGLAAAVARHARR